MKTKQNSVVKNITIASLIGSVASIVVSLVILGIIALLIIKRTVSINKGVYACALSHLLGSYLGCTIASLLTREYRIISCVAVIVVTSLLCFGFSIFGFENGIANTAWLVLCEIAGGVVCILTQNRNIGKLKMRRVRKKYL